MALSYATVEDVQAGFRTLSDTEKEKAGRLLTEAAVLIDTAAPSADADAKNIVSCRMVRRALGDDSSGGAFPMGATTGSMSALGYAQSWTLQSGSSGELYLGKTERQLLGLSNRIGSHSPLEDMA